VEKTSVYSSEELASAAPRAYSIAGLLAILGLKNSGGRRAGVRRDLDDLGIDTSHFRRQEWTKHPPDVALSASVDILVTQEAQTRPACGSCRTLSWIDPDVRVSASSCTEGMWSPCPLCDLWHW
jgi:hypothetical protein